MFHFSSGQSKLQLQLVSAFDLIIGEQCLHALNMYTHDFIRTFAQFCCNCKYCSLYLYTSHTHSHILTHTHTPHSLLTLTLTQNMESSTGKSPTSPRERSSRIFQGVQLKRSTVVVHGEQLVIRKLVVAGIVSAEKTYIDCLTAMREVCTCWHGNS